MGIRDIYCECLPDKESVEIGGGGMKLKTEDMARFAYFLLKKGKREAAPERGGKRKPETEEKINGRIYTLEEGY